MNHSAPLASSHVFIIKLRIFLRPHSTGTGLEKYVQRFQSWYFQKFPIDLVYFFRNFHNFDWPDQYVRSRSSVVLPSIKCKGISIWVPQCAHADITHINCAHQPFCISQLQQLYRRAKPAYRRITDVDICHFFLTQLHFDSFRCHLYTIVIEEVLWIKFTLQALTSARKLE